MLDERKPARDWQDIAYDASKERDPEKQKHLREELEIALEERAKKLHPQTARDAKKKAA